MSSCLCVQSTSLNQFVLLAFENSGNGLDGFRVHLVALRCDDMTSVQSAEMSLTFSRRGWNHEYPPAISDNSGSSEHADPTNVADQNHQEIVYQRCADAQFLEKKLQIWAVGM